jgi:hypothetical protein
VTSKTLAVTAVIKSFFPIYALSLKPFSETAAIRNETNHAFCFLLRRAGNSKVIRHPQNG